MAVLKTDQSGLRFQGIYNKKVGDSSPIGTYHMADNPEVYEPQRSNNFEFIVTNIDNLVRVGVLGEEVSDENATFKNAQEVLRLSVSASFVPHFSQTALSIKRGNSELKYAGVPSFKGGSIEFNDYIGAETKAILMAWQNLSYNVDTQKVGLASDYKKDAILVEYSPEYQIVRKWHLYGCWISNIDEQAYNSTSNETRRITATIEYDYATIETDENLYVPELDEDKVYPVQSRGYYNV